MAISIIETRWDESETALRNLRQQVFIDEQHVPEELEWDGEDDQAVHFMALDANQQPVGCIRLLPTGQISRLCVLSEQRNNGVGSSLLVAAEDAARGLGMEEIFLHAQTHATSFYEAAGFSVSGGIFMDANIPHRQMFKPLV
ncbi:MAG: GNAT family N-acetyltransferase [Alcanivoracaceae bacterium]|jgi:predicted GNAT family N-acyltransferase|uniref:GNAT family N-acetyltransferase n=1 Tax=Alcanivorax profundi TaxID=2338368 RepID=A0A418Y307_9GAMM|nr:MULTISPECIES: GNAT family N-acetyltransferase [Alcanivorax]MAX54032.1 GNAT family N-acetyltransferase [Alcanivoracaceae bacterium]MCG8437232.1 GNAT family N-acetyltransferase [Pseudomonadales bacterium]MEE2868949.1 GNAT family N-acetyltransferase [Pseudomonadota bacterium]ERP92755.1 acetyltransferase [Alcanivorax sp. P2S70]PNE01983.1 acetyltransferase [Alcanivorax sp. MD8A]|tara:strand:- start:108 stop:533 length:426 start_codon:yes stop_codon:yes gene_type:complete